jgi:hypothetical protein
MPEKTWLAAGIDKMEQRESIALCEKLFAERLEGNPLVSNARHLSGSAIWLKFNRVLCEKWFHKNIVLIGDAAHTAHFAIGSGTKLAMEDAMALARVLSTHDGNVEDALHRYQEEREIEALKLQSAARNRMEWFEEVERYVHQEPEQSAYRQPACGPCQPQAARLPLRGAGGEMVCRSQRRGPFTAADVYADFCPRRYAQEPRDLLAHGHVHGAGRCAERFPSRPSFSARDGWRGHGGDGDDLCFAGGAHYARLPRPVE